MWWCRIAALLHLLAIIVFIVISLVYFYPILQGKKIYQSDIAKYTGKSRSHITNILRLNDLTEYVKSKLVGGSIEMGHARAVLSLDMVKQESIIKQAVLRKLSVRSVESLARNSRTAPNKKIKNIDEYYIIKEIIDDVSSSISEKDRNCLLIYFSDFEINNIGKSAF